MTAKVSSMPMRVAERWACDALATAALVQGGVVFEMQLQSLAALGELRLSGRQRLESLGFTAGRRKPYGFFLDGIVIAYGGAVRFEHLRVFGVRDLLLVAFEHLIGFRTLPRHLLFRRVPCPPDPKWPRAATGSNACR